jgi:hypothetical protein
LLDAELVRNEKQALTWPGGQTHQHTPRWHGRLGQSNSGPHIVSGTLGTSHYHPNQYVIGTTYGQARHGSWRRSLSRLRWASSSQWTSPRRGLAGRLVDLLVCPSVCHPSVHPSVARLQDGDKGQSLKCATGWPPGGLLFNWPDARHQTMKTRAAGGSD